MARFHLIQIGSIFLTDDGSEDGKPCKTHVTGIGIISLDKVGTTRPQASGRPRTQLAQPKNIPISISVDYIHKDVHSDILEQLQDSLNDDTDFVLNISGDTGTFELTAIPDFPNHTNLTGDFSTNILKSVTYNFRTT